MQKGSNYIIYRMESPLVFFCNYIWFVLYCSLFSARELALNGM